MPDVMERRAAPRFPLILAAEITAMPVGATLHARTSDVSRTGCYIDTLNPVPAGTMVRSQLTRNGEVFEAIARVVYVSPGLGMGLPFADPPATQLCTLNRWLAEVSLGT
jgi:hypothetical protein